MRFPLPRTADFLPHLALILCLGLSVTAKGEENSIQISSKNPHSGISCAEIRAEQPIRYSLSGQNNAVVPGERSRLSAWVRFSDEVALNHGGPVACNRATRRGWESPLHLVVKSGRNS